MEKDNLVQDVNVKFPLFGKEIEIRFYDSNPTLIRDIMVEVKEKALELEKIFNFFDSESELSKLNAGREAKVSNHLLVVIKKALEFGNLTHGFYDVSLGKMFMARKQKLILPKLMCSYRDIEIKGTVVKLNHADVLIDLGSIAKGYITDELVSYLREKGISSALINSRGDIRNFGEIFEEIFIQDPRDSNKEITSFVLNNFAVATSGDYNQYDQTYEKSHIINSGKFISLTIISKNLMGADVIATALFTCSEKDFAKIIKKYPMIRIFGILKDQTQFKYNWFKNKRVLK